MAARSAGASGKAHGAHDAQRFASTFFEYERDNNIFLNALRQNSDLLAIVQYILDKEVCVHRS